VEDRTAFRNYQTTPRVEPTSLMAPRRRVMAEFLALVLVVACGLLGCLVALVAQDQPTRDAKPIKKRLRFEMKDDETLTESMSEGSDNSRVHLQRQAL
jgi:hypothetical protein